MSITKFSLNDFCYVVFRHRINSTSGKDNYRTHCAEW